MSFYVHLEKGIWDSGVLRPASEMDVMGRRDAVLSNRTRKDAVIVKLRFLNMFADSEYYYNALVTQLGVRIRI
jgi:hypothetical protein